jgi:hypothetical protein
VHWVVQSGPKVLVPGEESGQSFGLLWIAACAIVPWMAFIGTLGK